MSQPFNPIIYPLIICMASLAIAMMLLAYAVASITAAVRKRRATAITSWKERGVQFVLGPAQAKAAGEVLFAVDLRALAVGPEL